MYILSICDGHNASVALSKNGEVVFAISEERLTREKNYFGWPAVSLAHIDENYINLASIDKVVMYREDVADYLAFLIPEHIESSSAKDIWKKTITRVSLKARPVVNNSLFESWLRRYYSKKLGVSSNKLVLLNHHKAHAYAAFSEISACTEKWLHFVLDAEGDGISTSVLHFRDGDLDVVSSNDRHNSLGHFYSQITSYLGMKPNQHEFKVMGLEPYADRDSKGFKSCYQKFSDIIKLKDGKICFSISPATLKFKRYLYKNLPGERFDNVAAAAQIILEDIVIAYVKYWMNKQSIFRISMSGGVAMNVKLMQRLYEQDDINEIYVVPSSGDESCVLGCSNFFALSSGLELKKMGNLYLGVERNFEKEVESLKERRPDLLIEHYKDIDTEVAKLLFDGYVVARVCGRDEFGARALGNRSILANPRESKVIDLINKQVKDRDFWMPFTPSILIEKKDDLILNPRNYEATYMNITFNSTDYAQDVMPASLHPWDKTVRPQFVSKEQNASYHRLISKFYEFSGIPSVLNTSFNLHGDPNASSASDAIHAFDHSGLMFLQIDNYLIRK